jgi:hypothetical protein
MPKTLAVARLCSIRKVTQSWWRSISPMSRRLKMQSKNFNSNRPKESIWCSTAPAQLDLTLRAWASRHTRIKDPTLCTRWWVTHTDSSLTPSLWAKRALISLETVGWSPSHWQQLHLERKWTIRILFLLDLRELKRRIRHTTHRNNVINLFHHLRCRCTLLCSWPTIQEIMLLLLRVHLSL